MMMVSDDDDDNDDEGGGGGIAFSQNTPQCSNFQTIGIHRKYKHTSNIHLLDSLL